MNIAQLHAIIREAAGLAPAERHHAFAALHEQSLPVYLRAVEQIDSQRAAQRCSDGRTFAQWQQTGRDRNSLVADPGFADPEQGDFALPADSPALTLGFQPI